MRLGIIGVCAMLLASCAAVDGPVAPVATVRPGFVVNPHVWLRYYGSVADGWNLTTRCGPGAVDAEGNVFVSGIARPYVDGVRGENGVFLAKVTPDGRTLWTRLLASSGNERPHDLACDAAGNVYLSAATVGQLGDEPNAGGLDGVIVKHSPDGAILWARQFGSPSSDIAGAIAEDRHGRFYISGRAGFFDRPSRPFLCLLTSDNVVQWIRPMTPEEVHPRHMIVGTDGRLTTAGFGHFSGSRRADVSVERRGAAGELVWQVIIGSDTDETTGGLAVDEQGNTYVCGETRGVLNAEPGAGESNYAEGYVVKLDAGGQVIWMRQLPYQNRAAGLWADEQGAVIAGSGGGRIWLTWLDPAGRTVWVFSERLRGVGPIYDMAVDPAGNILIFAEGVRPGEGLDLDIVVAKYETTHQP